jgi:hypothetical protein
VEALFGIAGYQCILGIYVSFLKALKGGFYFHPVEEIAA